MSECFLGLACHLWLYSNFLFWKKDLRTFYGRSGNGRKFLAGQCSSDVGL